MDVAREERKRTQMKPSRKYSTAVREYKSKRLNESVYVRRAVLTFINSRKMDFRYYATVERSTAVIIKLNISKSARDVYSSSIFLKC